MNSDAESNTLLTINAHFNMLWNTLMAILLFFKEVKDKGKGCKSI